MKLCWKRKKGQADGESMGCGTLTIRTNHSYSNSHSVSLGRYFWHQIFRSNLPNEHVPRPLDAPRMSLDCTGRPLSNYFRFENERWNRTRSYLVHPSHSHSQPSEKMNNLDESDTSEFDATSRFRRESNWIITPSAGRTVPERCSKSSG